MLSPNWPEAYDKGQDCIWGLHVDEDKRIMLDVQVWVSVLKYQEVKEIHTAIEQKKYKHIQFTVDRNAI